MRSKRAATLFVRIFCLAFVCWKAEFFILVGTYLGKAPFAKRIPAEKIFIGFPYEVIEFARSQNFNSIFISDGAKSDLYHLYRMTYGLWPIKIQDDSEYGVFLKQEKVPAEFKVFQTGNEVDFVRRSH